MTTTYRRSFHWRILVILVAGGLIALTLLCTLWIRGANMQQHHLRMEKLNTNVRSVGNEMYTLVQKQYRTAQILSHSLSLRRYIIKIGQDLRQLPLNQVKEQLKDIQLLCESDPAKCKSIYNSLEAQYLKDAVKQSEGIIEKIEVTDAFGMVRVATERPDKLQMFQETWWQNTLMMRPEKIYSLTGFMIADDQYFWDISIPLRNDTGMDSVGVVRLRLKLNLIFQRALSTYEQKSVRTYIVTDRNLVYPPLPENDFNTLPFIRKTIALPTTSQMVENGVMQIGIANSPRILQTLVEDLNWRVAAIGEYPRNLSLNNPIFRRGVIYWFLGIFILSIISFIVSRWVTGPLAILTKGVHKVAEGKTDVKIPVTGRGELGALSRTFNKMTEHIEESRRQVSKLLRDQTRGLTALVQFTSETSMVWDYRQISKSLLQVSTRMLDADGGLVAVRRSGEIYEITDRLHISDAVFKILETQTNNPPLNRKLYFSWQHDQFKSLWENEYQILLIVPIKTPDVISGLMVLIFREAPEFDLESDNLLDIMGLLASINFSRSKLYREIVRQKNFIEGILSGIPSFIFTVNRNMAMTWHNQQGPWSWITRDKSHLIGSKCCVTLKDRNQECPDCPARQTLKDGDVHTLTQRWMGPEGGFRWVETTSYPLKDESGSISSVIMILTDITRSRENESYIRQFSHAIEHIAETVIITDREAHIQYTNKSFERTFGYSKDQITDESIEILFPGNAGSHVQKILNKIRENLVWEEDLELLDRFGKEISLTFTCSQVIDKGGFPTGLVFTGYDITVRRQKEIKLLDRFRDLALLNNISTLLTRGMSVPSMMEQVVNKICDFAGAESGLVLLREQIIGEKDDCDTRDIRIVASRNAPALPPYITKYIEEIQQGRSSSGYEKALRQRLPLIIPDTEVANAIEAKMIFRMGFRSLVSIPLRVAERNIGLIFLLSPTPFQFSKAQQDIFLSISSLIGIAFHSMVIRDRRLEEEHVSATGMVLDRIAMDLNEIIPELASPSGTSTDTETESLVHMIQTWHLSVMASNISDLGRDTPRLFFPENLQDIFNNLMDDLKTLPFLKHLNMSPPQSAEIGELYLNRVVLSRLIRNLIVLAVQSALTVDDYVILVSVSDLPDRKNYYGIQIEFSGTGTGSEASRIRIDHTDQLEFLPGSRFLLRCILDDLLFHRSELFMGYDGRDKRFRFSLELPRYPEGD